jgi:hypothetical protein
MSGNPLPPTDLGKGLGSLAGAVNPFGIPGQIASFLGSTLSPTVEWASNNTMGLVYGDKMVNFTFVLLFMVSLLVIILSDHVAMTASFRTFLLKLHFAMVKCVRAIVTIGLFFLGRAIGQSGSFMDGLNVGAPIVTAAASLFVVLRAIEGFSMTVPGQFYDESDKTLGPVPFIRGTMFFQSVFMVMRDYLNAVVNQCTDSLVGHNRILGVDLRSNQVYSEGGDTLPLNNIRYLWQAEAVQFKKITGDDESETLYAYPANDQSADFDPSVLGENASAALLSTGVFQQRWFYSPLFVGVIAGFVAK